jgi:iron complex transport system permease protein
MKGAPRLVWCLIVLAVVAIAGAAPLVGSTSLAPSDLWLALTDPQQADPTTVQIVHLRLSRVVLGLLVGACLAVAGAAFQTLLGNPLATPFTLGVAAAGSFGAFLALAVPALSLLGPLARISVQSLLWSSLDLLILYLLARRARWGSGALLLAGVTMNFLFAAGTMLLRLISDPYRLQAMDRWLMGGLDLVGWQAPLTILVQALPGLGLLILLAPALDQLAFGDAVAHGRGVAVRRARFAVLAAGVWVTAACVSQVGPIAFVGLLVPHAVRLLLGPSHRSVLPASLLVGGAFLVICDATARSLPLLGPGAEAPVGVVTALVGGPVFLAMLARRAGRGSAPRRG